ncbi:MAG: hypothetical protein IT372_27230 [Polyangiaceae bacterium]|nr:hypothetical protein [Polyangiaceae bacterium]
MQLREAVGRAIGGALAPAAWEGSLIRRARLFHPDGVVYRAEVRPIAAEGPLGDLGARLAGPALVRLSGGWWRWRAGRGERPDALGVAIRFRDRDEVSAEASPGDQDLLFESFSRLILLPIAPLITNYRDFLANTYHAVLPFEVAGLGRARFRLVPAPVKASGEDRRERLERAVEGGAAILRLDVRPLRRGARWTPIAEIALVERVALDQGALRFNPFRTGRGIVPSGLVQAIRAAAYAASQVGRATAGSR